MTKNWQWQTNAPHSLAVCCFDGLGNPPLQYQAHCPMEDILGYIRSHWTLPPGNYLHRIAPAATRVIGFGTHNQGCGGEYGTSG